MTVAIGFGSVRQVLLADGWHDVEPDTFTLKCDFFGASGAMWQVFNETRRMACPLIAILAVELDLEDQP